MKITFLINPYLKQLLTQCCKHKTVCCIHLLTLFQHSFTQSWISVQLVLFLQNYWYNNPLWQENIILSILFKGKRRFIKHGRISNYISSTNAHYNLWNCTRWSYYTLFLREKLPHLNKSHSCDRSLLAYSWLFFSIHMETLWSALYARLMFFVSTKDFSWELRAYMHLVFSCCWIYCNRECIFGLFTGPYTE